MIGTLLDYDYDAAMLLKKKQKDSRVKLKSDFMPIN